MKYLLFMVSMLYLYTKNTYYYSQYSTLGTCTYCAEREEGERDEREGGERREREGKREGGEREGENP